MIHHHDQRGSVSRGWVSLFPELEDVLGPLTQKQKQLVSILELIRIEDYVPYKPFRDIPKIRNVHAKTATVHA